MAVCDGEVFVCRCRNVWLSCFSQAHPLPHYIFFINSWEGYTLWPLDPVSCYNHVVCPNSKPVEYIFPKLTYNFYQNECPVRTWNIFGFEIQAFDFYVCNCEDYHNHPPELPHHFYFWYVVKGYLLLAIITPSYYFHFILWNFISDLEHCNYHLLI